MLVTLREPVKARDRSSFERDSKLSPPSSGERERETKELPSASTRAAVGAFALGIAARVAVTFPVHKTLNDADNVWNGLSALHILKGNVLLFYSGARLGAMECYVTAFFFALFGVSRGAMALTPVLVGILALGAFYFLVRELTDRRFAAVALLFFALPSPRYMFWTYVPTTYPTTVFLGILVLMVAAWIGRRGIGRFRMFAFGFACGLAWWSSPQTLSCIVPGAGWIAGRRREVLHSRRDIALAVAGLLLGAAPWIVYNVGHPFATFRQETHLSAAAGPVPVLENGRDAVTRALPQLLVRTVGDRAPKRERFLGSLALGVIYAAAAFLACSAAYRWLRHPASKIARPPAGFLFAAVAALAVLLYSASKAGTLFSQGYGDRYLLTAYLGVPVMLAYLVLEVAKASRAAAAAVALLVTALNVWGYYLPGSPERREWRYRAGQDAQAVSALERNGVGAITGDFWLVNPLAFVSGQHVRAVFDRSSDYETLRRVVPDATWALVNPWASQLRGWSAEVPLRGPIAAADGIEFWIADPRGPPANPRLDERLNGSGSPLSIPVGQGFFPIPACRALDTRQASAPGETPTLRPGIGKLRLAGRCGIPRSARSISLNMTLLGATAPGSLRFPLANETTASIGFGPGNTVSHAMVVAIEAGVLRIETRFSNPGAVNLIVDVNGYFEETRQTTAREAALPPIALQ